MVLTTSLWGSCVVPIVCIRKRTCGEVKDLALLYVANQGFKVKSVGFQVSGISSYLQLAPAGNGKRASGWKDLEVVIPVLCLSPSLCLHLVPLPLSLSLSPTFRTHLLTQLLTGKVRLVHLLLLIKLDREGLINTFLF